MSAAEIIEQIKSSSPDEVANRVRDLRAVLEQERDILKARIVEIERVLSSDLSSSDRQKTRTPEAPQIQYADNAAFQEAKEWAFKEHDELLRKLSK